MGFIILLVFTVLFLAGSAAFFSIYGLAQIFAGSFWPVVVMAVALEVGKLVAASFVYRFWKKLAFSMRIYLITAIVILMLITSMGIFGFLSGAYQKDILPLQQKEQKIILLEQEKEEIERLKIERLERKKQIDIDIASLPNDFVTGRQRLMESYKPELDVLRDDISNYTKRSREITIDMQELRSQKLEQEVHIGPIVFIADAFHKTTNEATKWLILLIIFAFDPLAVTLTIGVNLIIIERQKRKGTYFDDEPQRIQREIVEREIVNKEVHDDINTSKFFEEAFDRLEKKMEPSEEDKQLKTVIGQIIKRYKISQNLRMGKT